MANLGTSQMILLRRSRTAALALALAIAPAVGACGGKNGPSAVDYSVSAQKNYDRGLRQLDQHDWAAAAKYFAFIRSRFPYSKFAVLAELRLADAQFGAEQYIQAVDSYRLFSRLHPTHEMVANGYASLRVAEAYYKQLPGDMWILPPSYEKDQTSIEEAEDELRSFLDKFPDSPFRKRGQELVLRVSKRLAEHEWYVARYYWDRGKPTATVLRLRRLLERYPDTGYDVPALWLLGRAYAKTDLPDRARETWSQLIARFPKSKQADDAKTAIARLPAAKPTAAPTPPTP